MNPLSPIETVLTELLEWLHTSIGLTWAWAIVVLTLLVRMAILPLAVKQFRSMRRLQLHMPELKAIQAKYKSDRQKMNEEVMKFYRENNVNPLAPCLPILVQLPIFLGLFFVLRDFEEEVYLPFYPDSDLGWLGLAPNITQDVSSHWAGWLLLVIYVVSQFASIYFMKWTGESAMSPQAQRYILYALPFVAVPFVINFPIGVMLYWSTTNLWTVGQGLIIRRLVPTPEPAPKRSSRTPPKTVAADSEAAAGETPAGEAAPKPAGSGQQRVRRRKKKGPRAKR